MSINLKAYFCTSVSIYDIKEVLARSLGAQATEEGHCSGASTHASGSSSLTEIRIQIPTENAVILQAETAAIQKFQYSVHLNSEGVSYGVEAETGKHAAAPDITVDNSYTTGGANLIFESSSPIRLALMRRLVRFFGGKLVYSDNDSDFDPKNYYYYPVQLFARANSGEPVRRLQANLSKIVPLQQFELLEVESFAAYELTAGGVWNTRSIHEPLFTSWRDLCKHTMPENDYDPLWTHWFEQAFVNGSPYITPPKGYKPIAVSSHGTFKTVREMSGRSELEETLLPDNTTISNPATSRRFIEHFGA